MLEIKALSDTPLEALNLAAHHAPYLKRLLARQADLEDHLDFEPLYLQSLAKCTDLTTDQAAAEAVLRQAKAQAHLAIAARDLSGQDTVQQTTFRISEFADHACQAALAYVLNQKGFAQSGLFFIALGKMGAYELNYSSDIDLAAFWDAERSDFPPDSAAELASRIVRDTMSLLNRQTGEGYVFRTDLRLRPDPSSTPLAVPTQRAALYYESVGQNWERMVWIKARACAGDLTAAKDFLGAMQPFIWRQHLDYWAIADVQAIKHMINTQRGEMDLHHAATDIKLGPGGIREIEFFAQTQQIILGGRNPQLRLPATVATLQALAELGAVQPEVATGLADAYGQLRQLEHRLQMVQDQQTHSVPQNADKRASVAALCGYDTLAAFDADLLETRQWVSDQYTKLFEQSGRSHEPVAGNLVFTGVDDDPGTVQTLTELGFQSPGQVIARIRHWHHGHTPATRNRRGRERLTALLPTLLTKMSQMGDPDLAFARFSRFFEGLRSGVQTLSMLEAEPDLLEDLVATLALAPRIGETLAKRPNLLESLLTVSDQELGFEAKETVDFEAAINAMRRWHAAESFLLGHRLLHSQVRARDAARAWSHLADHAVQAMAQSAAKETERKFGPAPGQWVVAGLGKLGGEDMTANSDLDIILVYQAEGLEGAQTWYTRFTQRLITALSAETAEGSLYEVDMRLRPSGRAGPVATSLQAFQRYHLESAWTWEHMALTRLRPICGDPVLGQKLIQISLSTRGQRPPQTVTQDILEMRKRLNRDKPAGGPWDLKLRPGGLLDIEFILQHALLCKPSSEHTPRISDALRWLKAHTHLSSEEFAHLDTAYRFLRSLQQVQRIANEPGTFEQDMMPGLADRLCRATDQFDFEDLKIQLEQHCGTVFELFGKKIGNPATE